MPFPSKRLFRLNGGTKRMKYFILNSSQNGKLFKQFTTHNDDDDDDEKMKNNSESCTPKILNTT